MPEIVLKVANDSVLWMIAFAIVAVVFVQSMIYMKLSFKVANDIGLSRDKCIRGFRSGMVSAIGPSLSVFVVMVGMMAVVGAPITWLRLSIIGAAPTELTAATVGAQAYGVEFGSAQYDLGALAASFWTMAINGTGWLLFVGLFAGNLETIREKMAGGDSKWLAVISGAAMLGAYGYLNANNIVGAVRAMETKPEAVAIIYAVAGGMLSMPLLSIIARKHIWLKEYALGIAMIIGMCAAALMK